MSVIDEPASGQRPVIPRILVSVADTESGPITYHEEAAEIEEHSGCGDAATDEFEDIYRGEPSSASPPPPSPLPRQTGLAFETHSTASSVSSSSIIVGRRIGAIALVVEQAISRWVGTHASDSSTSLSSSASSASSRRTRSTRRNHNRKHAESVSIHNAARERSLRERRRVHEESRATPRGFTLFLPPELAYPQLSEAAFGGPSSTFDGPKRVMQTTSLPDILTRLEAALKQSSRVRKARLKEAPAHAGNEASQKGKNKYQEPHDRASGGGGPHRAPSAGAASSKSQCGWWLDVTSPTWDDLRSIGKVRYY